MSTCERGQSIVGGKSSYIQDDNWYVGKRHLTSYIQDGNWYVGKRHPSNFLCDYHSEHYVYIVKYKYVLFHHKCISCKDTILSTRSSWVTESLQDEQWWELFGIPATEKSMCYTKLFHPKLISYKDTILSTVRWAIMRIVWHSCNRRTNFQIWQTPCSCLPPSGGNMQLCIIIKQ